MARPVLFSEIIDSQEVNGNTYVKFTDVEKSKLAGIAEGATAGAAWEEVTGRPTTLSELDNAAAVSLAGKLSKSGGTMTGDITMGEGARILLSGSPANANEPISLSYFQTHKERSDFQADVDAIVTDPANQFPGDGTLPSAAIGQRYILASAAAPHANWGTIEGSPDDGDIIQYKNIDGTPTWIVVYDITEHGEGVLTWNRATKQWLNYTTALGWGAHGGLSVYTAGNGLDLVNGAFVVKPDTTGGHVFPVSSTENGTSILIDNNTIKKNEFNQLYADIAVPQGMYTTGFMHKVTALDVSNGYITFPTGPTPPAMPPIASGKLSSVVITIPGGSGQVSAARSVYVSNDPAPDFSLDPLNLNRIIIRTAAAGMTLTDSILEDDVLDIVYTASGS